MRQDNRERDVLRPIQIERGFTKHAPGSVLITVGDTKVICTASVEESVPFFLRGSESGWLTAEYSMLPGSTHTRVRREVSKGKASGRTNEIQRLIGRSLRAALDLTQLGERSIHIDCDVIQADGGTRTASITGGMVALYDAISSLQKSGRLDASPIINWISAVSVGVVNNAVYLDLNYEEDSSADVDMNLVMTESGKLIEIQGTAEKEPFDDDVLFEMIKFGKKGITELIQQTKPA